MKRLYEAVMCIVIAFTLCGCMSEESKHQKRIKELEVEIEETKRNIEDTQREIDRLMNGYR